MIKNGYYDGATISESPNFSNRAIVPRFIVMHYTAAWTVDSTLARFKDPAAKVSAQFTIDTDGTVYQHVSTELRAWHAGPSEYKGFTDLNSHSVGIEFVNPGFLRKTSDGFVDAYGGHFTAEKVGAVVEAPNPRVGSGNFYWPLYTEAQLAAADKLVGNLIDKYDILDIVTHEQIDTRGWKTDPGPAFPMNRYRALLPDRVRSVVHYTVLPKTLNVRNGPGTQFEVRNSISAGTVVSELGREGSWVRISDDGWVHGGYLRLAA